ncbi:hypothetical protein H7R39_00955 [Campylobacter sp. Marseille-Q3452]|uniref:Uncharacterized protein n=1 Tax=Campylobacter massiliensis TaxID=2762557 RepID=A0A842J2S1_9BACT|nr:hypothetical protein [Campylobacter massiliensis]MBC2881861.1 hypothetical protein [Campylobacter massiliensis]
MKRDKTGQNLGAKRANKLPQIYKNYVAQTSSNLTPNGKSVNLPTGAKFC